MFCLRAEANLPDYVIGTLRDVAERTRNLDDAELGRIVSRTLPFKRSQPGDFLDIMRSAYAFLKTRKHPGKPSLAK